MKNNENIKEDLKTNKIFMNWLSDIAVKGNPLELKNMEKIFATITGKNPDQITPLDIEKVLAGKNRDMLLEKTGFNEMRKRNLVDEYIAPYKKEPSNKSNGGCNEAKILVYFKKVKGVKTLDINEVKLGAGIKGCNDGKAKFRQEAKKLLGRVVKQAGAEKVIASDVQIPSWDQVGIEYMTNRIEQRKQKEQEYVERRESGQLTESDKKKTPMLLPDNVIEKISRADYEGLWENYKKGFKKGWEKATELYNLQINAIIKGLKQKPGEVEDEESEEEIEEEMEELEEDPGEETDMAANVSKRSKKIVKNMAKKLNKSEITDLKAEIKSINKTILSVDLKGDDLFIKVDSDKFLYKGSGHDIMELVDKLEDAKGYVLNLHILKTFDD